MKYLWFVILLVPFFQVNATELNLKQENKCFSYEEKSKMDAKDAILKYFKECKFAPIIDEAKEVYIYPYFSEKTRRNLKWVSKTTDLSFKANGDEVSYRLTFEYRF